MTRMFQLLSFAVLLGMASNSYALDILINFDKDFDGNTLSHLDSTIASYPSPHFTFSDDFIILDLGGGDHSPPNSARAVTDPVSILFTNLASFVEAYPVTNSSVTLTAFDEAGNILDTATGIGGSTVPSLPLVRVEAPNIKRVEFSSQSGDPFIDDLRFGVLEAVPEPSTFVLAGLGLLGLGFVALRKKYRRA